MILNAFFCLWTKWPYNDLKPIRIPVCRFCHICGMGASASSGPFDCGTTIQTDYRKPFDILLPDTSFWSFCRCVCQCNDTEKNHRKLLGYATFVWWYSRGVFDDPGIILRAAPFTKIPIVGSPFLAMLLRTRRVRYYSFLFIPIMSVSHLKSWTASKTLTAKPTQESGSILIGLLIVWNLFCDGADGFGVL